MKTTDCIDAADYIWLTGDEARGILADLTAETAPLHTVVAQLRGQLSVVRTHLLLQQTELRRRAVAKFRCAETMFFTRIGLEQATDEWVAAYKAQQINLRHGLATPRVADLCCGIGGDLTEFAVRASTVGVDLDPMAAHFAQVNSGATVHVVDVENFDLTGLDVLHIDPDRRTASGRTTTIDAFRPPLDAIERLLHCTPQSVVKLAPATRVPAAWEQRCELEWISRDGECRQLVAWHGGLCQAPGGRCATVLSSLPAGTPRTIRGDANQPVDVGGKIEEFIFDVDAAVLAAHLKGALATEHSLRALSAGETYLTGPRAINDAALDCFKVVDVLPLETRKLARYFTERGIGRLEIKKRGIEADVEKTRRALKLRGDHAATLMMTRTGGRGIAIVAHRAS